MRPETAVPVQWDGQAEPERRGRAAYSWGCWGVGEVQVVGVIAVIRLCRRWWRPGNAARQRLLHHLLHRWRRSLSASYRRPAASLEMLTTGLASELQCHCRTTAAISCFQDLLMRVTIPCHLMGQPNHPCLADMVEQAGGASQDNLTQAMKKL